MDNTAFFAAFGALALAGAVDRFLLRRGKIDIISVTPAGRQGDYLRFNLTYKAHGRPCWSELRYQFRDHEHPTTVIEGKTRSLSDCRKGRCSEYLLIRADKLESASQNGTPETRWDLNVRITTTNPQNPFYSYFPLISRKNIAVYINPKEGSDR